LRLRGSRRGREIDPEGALDLLLGTPELREAPPQRTGDLPDLVGRQRGGGGGGGARHRRTRLAGRRRRFGARVGGVSIGAASGPHTTRRTRTRAAVRRLV